MVQKSRLPKDNGEEISKQEWDEAVDLLIRRFSKETLLEIKEAMGLKGEKWASEKHHNFGTKVRNILREGGFDWGSISLDSNWIRLLKDALQRFEVEI